MMIRPDVSVRLGKKRVPCTIISNSIIYGIIRQRAREVIDKAVEEKPELKKLVTSVRNATIGNQERTRKELWSYLTESMKSGDRDAVLMVEYAGLDFGKMKSFPFDRSFIGLLGKDNIELKQLQSTNLGPLAAIGEQKATQFFAQLAGCFDSEAAAAYEDIFKAWGGDVRELSVDLKTGKIRPRELTIENVNKKKVNRTSWFDPTVYARVDYLDSEANISESEKASCRTILKNLPVVFTFAPMNILHYHVKFLPNSTQTLTVSYKQYAFSDTRRPSSYQLAYVVHPASFWKEFGPINLEVTVPKGIACRASVPLDNLPNFGNNPKRPGTDIYTTTLQDKTGEIYLAVNAEEWRALNIQKDKVQQIARIAK